jgi:serine/threonine-protein kinase
VWDAGQRIGERYRLLARLGQGGMGEVWEALNEVTERRVAIKLLHPSRSLTLDLRARLLREARAASRVRHPNVVEVLDAFTTPAGEPVVVMERLEGETLAQRLKRNGKLSLADATPILAQLVSAVGAAHRFGVVHRDLKPDNVFLCRGGDDTVVKVLDFGIAKLTGAEADGSLTQAGHTLGTPAYMAPEQCRGAKDVDHRADLWAIGVITYEMLAGTRPIPGDTVGEIVEALLTLGVPPLRTLVPDVPFDLAVAARRLLERAPDARPSDLRELAQVLARHSTRTVPPLDPPEAASDTTSDRGAQAEIVRAEIVTPKTLAGATTTLATLPMQRSWPTWAITGVALLGAALAILWRTDPLQARASWSIAPPSLSAPPSPEEDQAVPALVVEEPPQPSRRPAVRPPRTAAPPSKADAVGETSGETPPPRPAYCADHRQAFRLNSEGLWELKPECAQRH